MWQVPLIFAFLQVIVGVTPDIAFIKTVNDELVELMGSKGAKDLEQGFPQIILMAGLQVNTNPPKPNKSIIIFHHLGLCVGSTY